MPARILVAEASEQFLGRQVFWLTARSGPGLPSRRVRGSGVCFTGDLADYSGGPATDLHRFPNAGFPVGSGHLSSTMVMI
jgi:hypothetical protein